MAKALFDLIFLFKLFEIMKLIGASVLHSAHSHSHPRRLRSLSLESFQATVSQQYDPEQGHRVAVLEHPEKSMTVLAWCDGSFCAPKSSACSFPALQTCTSNLGKGNKSHHPQKVTNLWSKFLLMRKPNVMKPIGLLWPRQLHTLGITPQL